MANEAILIGQVKWKELTAIAVILRRQVVLSLSQPMLAAGSTTAVVIMTTFVKSSNKAERE
jgi:hypothetical protein